MAIVASVREEAPPMVTTGGTAAPVGASPGIFIFTCTSPQKISPSNARSGS